MLDGVAIELDGRQLLGLSRAAEQSSSGLVAFKLQESRRRVILSAAVIAKLRANVEESTAVNLDDAWADSAETSDADSLDQLEMVATDLRAVTAGGPPPTVTPHETTRRATAPDASRSQIRPPSHRWLRAASLIGMTAMSRAPPICTGQGARTTAGTK